MDQTTLVKDNLIKKYMGILNKKSSKNEKSQSLFNSEEKEYVNQLTKNGQHSEGLEYLDNLFSRLGDNAYNCSDGFEIIKRSIEISYEMNDKEKAYKYIALLSLTSRAQSNIGDYLFSVSELSFNARDIHFANGIIKALYQYSDGAYFCYEERKKYLDSAGIIDNRTFDDYSEDY